MENIIYCNTRNLHNALTGVQRYTFEVVSRISNMTDLQVKTICPATPMSGLAGHSWEQLVLPFKVGKRVLWSPSNTGPLGVENQVISLMDCSPIDHPEWSSPKFSGWYQFLLPRLVRKVKKIITISEFSKERILHYWPDVAPKIEVTMLAASEYFVPSNNLAIDEMFNRLKLPTKNYILAIGSIEPRKNLNSLLKAWERVCSIMPDDVWLVIAGGVGKKLIFGDQSFDKLPQKVFLTGRVEDGMLPALYSGAIASVYLSLYEGFGLPPLESMSCGTPVITSNTTSLPEVVGDAAILVDPLDIDSIAQQLINIVADSTLRSKLSSLGTFRAKEFNWDKTAMNTADILKKVVNS